MSTWRPNNWKRPYEFVVSPTFKELVLAEQTDAVRFLENEAYEAGAGAMLEAIRDNPIRLESQIVETECNKLNNGYDIFVINYVTLECMNKTQKKIGTWVFIPDDKEGK